MTYDKQFHGFYYYIPFIQVLCNFSVSFRATYRLSIVWEFDKAVSGDYRVRPFLSTFRLSVWPALDESITGAGLRVMGVPTTYSTHRDKLLFGQMSLECVRWIDGIDRHQVPFTSH